MAEIKSWKEVLGEIEDLCKVHGDAIADFERCREFNGRLSGLLAIIEDMDSPQIADRTMDTLSSCSPKIGSHCENSMRTRGMLERLRDRIREKASEKNKDQR